MDANDKMILAWYHYISAICFCSLIKIHQLWMHQVIDNFNNAAAKANISNAMIKNQLWPDVRDLEHPEKVIMIKVFVLSNIIER